MNLILLKKNLMLASTSGNTGTVPATKAATNPGHALNGKTVATGDAVESTMYDSSSWETRCLSATGLTVVPANTVLTVPP